MTEDYLTNDPLARWDTSVAAWFAERRTAIGVDVFRTITDLGNPVGSLAVATVVCIVLFRRRQLAAAALLPLVLGGGELLNLILKVAFHRARPEHGVVHLDTYSYPSGHVMVATATYGAFAWLLWSRMNSRRGRVFAVLSMLVIVLLISLSRVYLGVHYLSDVLGAIAAGATWLALSLALYAAYADRFAASLAGSRFDLAMRRLTRS